MEERGSRNEAVLGVLFFCFLIFFFNSKESILVTLQSQNDIVLGFPSILIVLPNGGGQTVRSW
jgi:hypothetical protein